MKDQHPEEKEFWVRLAIMGQVGLLSVVMMSVYEHPHRPGDIPMLVMLALSALFGWMFMMRRRRDEITNTPTSRIASAAQGYVKLIGVGRPDELPLFSRRTKQPCLWYRYRQINMEMEGGEGEQDVSNASFIIDDGSGCCVVDVEGAEIMTRHKKTWYAEGFLHTEWTLLSGDTLYAFGEFRTFGGGSVDLDARRDMGELLTEWKKDKKGLLERFDLDKNGEISETEWGLARQAARREVSKMHTEARSAPDVHTLRRPSDGRRYLISNFDPKWRARRYLLWALFQLVVFLSALGTIPFAL